MEISKNHSISEWFLVFIQKMFQHHPIAPGAKIVREHMSDSQF